MGRRKLWTGKRLRKIAADLRKLKICVSPNTVRRLLHEKKWNPIEHRLFSEISKHWAGQPLDTYQTIQRLI